MTTAAPTTAPPTEPPWGLLFSQTIWCLPIEIELELFGEPLNVVLHESMNIDLEVEIVGNIAPGQFIDCGPIEIEIEIKSFSVPIIGGSRCNWVKWAKIGRLDFTIDESNLAGERPMDWAGCVYRILKLGNDSIVVYGTNGVTVMKPTGVNWGMQTIHKLGAIARTAIDGNDSEHYFIDSVNKLYQITSQGMKLLDYSEYLGDLTNPRLCLDNSTGLLYICDGEHGFVYSPKSESLGEGPHSITGIQMKTGTLYVTSSEDIVIPKFHICTDTYDLGERKPKTIQQLEIGTNLRVGLEAMIESRINNRDHFRHGAWRLVSPNGIAEIPCYGVEFRFHLRSFIYEYFELDYIRVNGAIHGYTYLESI